jgi:hypothetical protein
VAAVSRSPVLQARWLEALQRPGAKSAGEFHMSLTWPGGAAILPLIQENSYAPSGFASVIVWLYSKPA